MKFNTEIDKGLSEFIQSTTVRRQNNIAEIIVDHFNGDPKKPVRLIGFTADPTKTDFEILEEGFHYYNELKRNLKKLKEK